MGTFCTPLLRILVRCAVMGATLGVISSLMVNCSLVEYAYCALASAGALRRARCLPWSCHAQLFASGLLYR